MSLRTRDIEDLLKRYGTEQGTRKALMLITEAVVAQQEALMEMAQTVDLLAGTVASLANISEALVGATRKVERKLGLNIDDGDMSSEPISDMGNDEGRGPH